MDKLKFADYTEFGNYIYQLAKEDGYSVTAILFSDEIVELLKWILLYDDINVGKINIEQDDCDEYRRDYYITVNNDLTIDVLPAYTYDTEKTYNEINSDIVFYNKNIDSNIATTNNYSTNYEFIIDNKSNKCGDCCEDCNICPHKDVSQTLTETLEIFDYILNHFGD